MDADDNQTTAIITNTTNMNQIMVELQRNNEKLTEVISNQNDLAEAKREIDSLKNQEKIQSVRNVPLKNRTFLNKFINFSFTKFLNTKPILFSCLKK